MAVCRVAIEWIATVKLSRPADTAIIHYDPDPNDCAIVKKDQVLCS